jgi:hypothetical protein
VLNIDKTAFILKHHKLKVMNERSLEIPSEGKASCNKQPDMQN